MTAGLSYLYFFIDDFPRRFQVLIMFFRSWKEAMARTSKVKKRWALTAMVAGVVAYLALWPIPAQPVAWEAAASPGYAGAHARNTRLAGLRTIGIGAETGPEHIALGPDGKLYAAVTSGKILRMDPDGARREVFADTGGRVLGFAFDRTGALIAADADRGLLSIAPDRQVSVLADRTAAGDRIRYADGVIVAGDGAIYFTDASSRFAPREWGGTFEASVLDILEQSASGRVLAYDPASGRTRVVAHGLSFANGIALSLDGHALFVNETGRYRIWKIDAHADGVDVRTGTPAARVLFDNLPGYPDNLMRGRDGRLWVGLAKPRNPTIDRLAARPFLRGMILRLPRALWPVPQAYGHVFAFDEGGAVLADLQDPAGAYPETTGVTEAAGRLYIQSLHADHIGWLPGLP
jgi:sugar lactone lactonase YvrE